MTWNKNKTKQNQTNNKKNQKQQNAAKRLRGEEKAGESEIKVTLPQKLLCRPTARGG